VFDHRHRSPADLVAAARAAGVRDERLLAAIAALPRTSFVPLESAAEAYRDVPVRISHGQVTTQPSLVAGMVEALELRGEEKVLEVGTGYGYQTALLASLAREVWSVELWPDMADAAREALTEFGFANARLAVGDGTLGLPAQAPFDAIVVSAAFPAVPKPLEEQLAPGGRLVQPIGPGGAEEVILFAKKGTELEADRSLSGAYFVRLFGKHGYPLGEAPPGR
jgi:protein-L-isoaspartate(D-aspartate) O-methyltransferase